MGTLKRLLRVRYLSIFLAVAVALFVAVLVIPNAVIIAESRPFIVSSIDRLEETEVAIVLGAKVHDDGRLSWSLRERVEMGAELYIAGKVKKILMTGDHGRKAYDEVNAMRRYALDLGVRPQDIFMDHAGFSTYESMYRAREVFLVKRAVVVTQDYHLRRALYMARALGLEAYGIPADKYPLPYVDKLREIVARVKGFVEVAITKPKPTFLGPAIPITGDGRVTNDKGGY